MLGSYILSTVGCGYWRGQPDGPSDICGLCDGGGPHLRTDHQAQGNDGSGQDDPVNSYSTVFIVAEVFNIVKNPHSSGYR